MQYAIVPVSGPVTFVEVERIDLDDLYKGTGADTVEALDLTRDGDDAIAWMDEDYIGKAQDGDIALNPRADQFIRHLSPGTLIGAPGISGDVVMTGPADDEGDTLGLPESWHKFLTELTAEDLQMA